MNSRETLLLILGLLSFLMNACFIYRLVTLGREFRWLAQELTDIRKAGFQRRIHCGLTRRQLLKLSTELNNLLDCFQSSLEEKQRLELSYKQLIANVSHDIRTPLTSLLGYLEVLKDQQLKPADQQEYLAIVYAKAKSMYQMIEEFFDLARLESEDTTVTLIRVDLAEIVRESLASFYRDFTQAAVVLEIRLPETSVIVWGNRSCLGRVMDNLLTNALKYGSDGGTIGLSIREEADRAWVDIADHGRGIPENELPFVFDRLYTSEASRNATLRGTGLGLAIARQLIIRQRGEITAASIPGERTVFSFCLMKAPTDDMEKIN